MSLTRSGLPPTPDQPREGLEEDRLKLLLDAFPGLAGSLHIASVDGGLAPRFAGSALPRNISASGASPEAQLIQPVGLSRPVSDVLPYPNQAPSRLATATTHNRQAPGQHHASKVWQPRQGSPTATALDNKGNINDLARIIMSEASTGNDAERSSVGFTVLNRMRRNGTARVKDVSSAYSHDQTPAPWAISLATKILKKQLSDPTNGATHFYSPQYMPMEGQKTGRADIGGGLEQSGHLKKKNFRPGYAKTYPRVKVPDVSEERFKFWRAPGNGPVR